MKDIYIETDRLLTDADYMEQPNLLDTEGKTFQPNSHPSNYDNYVEYKSITTNMVKGNTYIISAQTNGTFTKNHDGSHESNNAVLWLCDPKGYFNVIVSDSNTSTGTRFVWTNSTSIAYLRVNTYKQDGSTKVWNVKLQSCDNKIATDQNIADLQQQINELKNNK